MAWQAGASAARVFGVCMCMRAHLCKSVCVCIVCVRSSGGGVRVYVVCVHSAVRVRAACVTPVCAHVCLIID